MVIKMNGFNPQETFLKIQKEIELAQKENRPIADYVKKQIKILEQSHDEFINTALAKGYSLSNPQVGEIEVQQYSAMKSLAEKAGLPIEKYDELIKRVQIRIFGEENYKRFFEKNK